MGKKIKVIVTGDFQMDWLTYTEPKSLYSENKGLNPSWGYYDHTKIFPKLSGAWSQAKSIISALNTNYLGDTEVEIIQPSYPKSYTEGMSAIVHSFINIKMEKDDSYYFNKEKITRRFKVSQQIGYDGPQSGRALPSLVYVDSLNKRKGQTADADLVVIDDLGYGFRDNLNIWPKCIGPGAKGKKPVIIYRMRNIFSSGDLWHKLEEYRQRMIVVIRADDLRSNGINISRRLSHERSAGDLCACIIEHPTLRGFAECAYTIVRFGIDSAILFTRANDVDGKKIVKGRIYYNPNLGEGLYAESYKNKMFGIGSVFVSVLAREIIKHGIQKEQEFPIHDLAVKHGVHEAIIASCRLWRLGYIEETTKKKPKKKVIRTPYERIFTQKKIDDDVSITAVDFPDELSQDENCRKTWTILENKWNDLGIENLAVDCVKKGSGKALSSVPVARFQELSTFDRQEMESFRSIRNLIIEYLDNSGNSKPLSIAVFGSPGSGKSFGIKEIIKDIAKNKTELLEFNLSQFHDSNLLIGAFHQVRDKNLKGKMPVVFFDEFDSKCDQVPLGWLKHFLAPMQDGTFVDENISHPLGRGIFIFAGGIFDSMAEFQNGKRKSSNDEGEVREFVMAKGPDFLSRLRGYIDIKSVDMPDANNKDNSFMIRRALIIRNHLEKNYPKLFVDNDLHIDSALLHAFLRVPKYKHGARSLTAIIDMSTLSKKTRFELSALPPLEQLELHVDTEDFMNEVKNYELAVMCSATVADKKVQNQLEICLENMLGERTFIDPRDKYEDKSQTVKKDTSYTEKINSQLAIIGCRIVRKEEPGLAKRLFNENELDIIGRRNHEEWLLKTQNVDKMTYNIQSNYRNKTNKHIVLWEDLPLDIKDWLKFQINNLPDGLMKDEFKIVQYARDDVTPLWET
jgi:Predicted ATPase